MNECKIGKKEWIKSLEDFVRHVRGNKHKLGGLQEKLERANYQFYYSAPGPNYERIGTPSNVQPSRMNVLLDRIWTLKHKIAEVEESEKILHNFEAKLTEKELKVFHLSYFKLYSQGRVAVTMGVTQQCIGQYISKLQKKWAVFSK